MPGKDFSTRVECLEGLDIAVERTMIWGGGNEGRSSVGVTSPATCWYLPEGCSDYGFETWTLIQNPNERDVICDVTYMIQGEEPVTVPKAMERPRSTVGEYPTGSPVAAGTWTHVFVRNILPVQSAFLFLSRYEVGSVQDSLRSGSLSGSCSGGGP